MASTYRRAVGVFSSRTQTASALQALSDSGFSMGDVSVIAKDADHQKDIAGVTVRDEVTNQADKGGAIGALTGGVLGGVTGLLVGLGTLTIPGLGPALLAGEAAAVLTTVVGGAAGAAAGGLVGALVGLGIPEHRAVRYQDRVAQGGYLVMVKGDENEIIRAERTLGDAGIEDWGVYQADDDASRVSPAATAAASPAHEIHRETHRDLRAIDGRDRTTDLPRSSSSSVAGAVSADDTYSRSNAGNTLDSRRDLRQADDHYRTAGLPHSSNPVAAGSPQTGAAAGDTSGSAERRVVGVFLNQRQMDEALAQLQQTGFPVHSLSIAVREAETPSSGQHRDSGGHSLSGATQLVAGLDRVLLPDVGTVMVMGPDAQALSDTFLQDRSGSNDRPDRSTMVADGLGIAPESARLYRRHLTDGAYLVTLRGNNQDVLEAASTLGKWGMHDWGIYDVWSR